MVRGGTPAETELTAREHRNLRRDFGPSLRKRGLLFVGIDVIGGYLTEINVTSPTRAVKNFGRVDIAAMSWDRIEEKRSSRSRQPEARRDRASAVWTLLPGQAFPNCSCAGSRASDEGTQAGLGMVQRVTTPVSVRGGGARAVDVQVQVAPGLRPSTVVGLPGRQLPEAKERVRAALVASGLALPARARRPSIWHPQEIFPRRGAITTSPLRLA